MKDVVPPHSTFGARRPAIPFAAIWCHLSLHRVPTASSVCKPVSIIVFQNRARQCPTDYFIRSTWYKQTMQQYYCCTAHAPVVLARREKDHY